MINKWPPPSAPEKYKLFIFSVCKPFFLPVSCPFYVCFYWNPVFPLLSLFQCVSMCSQQLFLSVSTTWSVHPNRQRPFNPNQWWTLNKSPLFQFFIFCNLPQSLSFFLLTMFKTLLISFIPPRLHTHTNTNTNLHLLTKLIFDTHR